MGNELAAAYVQIIPSVKGISEALRKEIGAKEYVLPEPKMPNWKQKVKDAFDDLHASASSAAEAAATEMANQSSSAVKAISQNFSIAFAQAAQGSSASIKNISRALLTSLTSALHKITTKISNAFTPFLKTAHAKIAPVFNSISTAGRAAFNRVAVLGASALSVFVSKTVKSAGVIAGTITGPFIEPFSKIKGAFSQLKSVFNPLKNAAIQAAFQIKYALTGAFKSIAVAGGAAFAALTGAVASFIPSAIAASDATDKFKSTLKFAGLETTQIDALAASARKYADETVYSLSDIQSITAQLAANSVKDFDKLAEAAGNLNAAAGGNAETYKSFGMVLTQTAGVGKLTTENWNQLSEAVPGASGKIQEALLKNSAYIGNFRDAMAQGQITAEEFNQALLDLGFDQAAVNAAKSTKTFEGAIGNLQAALEGGLQDAINKIKPHLVGFINNVTPIIEKGFLAFNTFIEKIDFSSFTSAFTGTLPVLGALGGVLGGLAGNLPIIGGLFQGLTGPVGLVIGLFTGIVTNSRALTVAFNTAFNSIRTAVQAFAPIFTSAFTSISNILGQIGNTIAPFVAATAAAFTQLVQIVTPLLTQLLTAFTPLITLIMARIIPIIQGLIPLVQTVLTAIIDIVTPAISTIQAVIQTVMALIQGDWDGAWEGIKNIFFGAWETMQNLVVGVLSAIGSIISSTWNTVKEVFFIAWDLMTGIVSRAWGLITTALKNGVSTVISVVTGLPSQILAALGNLGTLLYDSGKALLTGFVDGIKAAIGWVTDTISSVVSSIRDFFPFSPAKKGPFSGKGWVLYSGLSIGEAFADGISESSIRAYKAAANLSGVTRKALTQTTLQPQIRGGYQAMGAAQSLTTGMGDTRLTLVVEGREFPAYILEKAGSLPGVKAATQLVEAKTRLATQFAI